MAVSKPLKSISFGEHVLEICEDFLGRLVLDLDGIEFVVADDDLERALRGYINETKSAPVSRERRYYEPAEIERDIEEFFFEQLQRTPSEQS